jgi:hypothetical protein
MPEIQPGVLAGSGYRSMKRASGSDARALIDHPVTHNPGGSSPSNEGS